MLSENTESIVIVGGGHAAAQLCIGLAAAGLGGQVHLVCEETALPYQRPPLSKAFLKNPAEALQLHRPEAWYAEAGITVHRGDPAVAIDRAAHLLHLQSGAVLPYHRLVLATGARARHLPHLPAALGNVFSLRSAADALRLRAALPEAAAVTLLGGGFIGLEIAASARALGQAVTVLESAPRLLARSVSPELAAHVLQVHRAAGIDVQLGVAVGGFQIEGDRLQSLEVDGQRVAVSLLVLGIGASPEDRLAHAAGLDCANGVCVDELMRTSDPAVLAIGDCASFLPAGGGPRLRLESVPNASEQARTALATLQGREQAHAALPWFWSEQGSMRLQMAGLMPASSERFIRPGASAASFSVLHYEGARLACVESVNAPHDHLAARKLLETGRSPAPDLACDAGVALKMHV
jgi:3-phenylpropionate/trans-cinnamate dioxygenase ferredoxin reductase subunit